MKNSIALFLFIAICGAHFISKAQEITLNRRFKGGEVAFIGYMSNLKYPEKSIKNGVIGYSITGITITPNGDIDDVFTINPLDEDIDLQVTAALLETKGKWLKSDSLTTNQTFYVQVIFQIFDPGITPSTNSPLLDIFNFLEPVYITGTKNKKTTIETNDLIADKLTKSMKENKPQESLKYIDELIRRNPFLRGLYQLRISLNKILKRNDLVSKDVYKLHNFIPGVSLDDFLTAFSQKQENDKLLVKQTDEKITDASKVERMPEYPGGQKEMMNFIIRNLKYPEGAASQNIQGTVIVRFVITEDGKITNATILKGVHPLLNAEALRVIHLMPDWIPGIQDEKPVKVFYTLPFGFKMERTSSSH